VRIRWPFTFRSAIRRRPDGAPVTSDRLGRRGERAAERALLRAGYRILARRRRFGGAEVDLVALDGATVVLVEVKSTAGGVRAPAGRVGALKVRRLRAAWRALALDPRLAARPRRLDVVEVRFVKGRPECRLRRDHARL
jgi:putative endonuclease